MVMCMHIATFVGAYIQCTGHVHVMLLHVDWKACQIVLAKTARIRIWDPKRHNMTFNQKKQQIFCMKTSFDSAK